MSCGGGGLPGHGCVPRPTPGLPSCFMIFFNHIEKTGGSTVRRWLSSLRSLYGFGFISKYDPTDTPHLLSPHEAAARYKYGHVPELLWRWRQALNTTAEGAPVPSECAWRVAREYHWLDLQRLEWGQLLSQVGGSD